MRRYRDCSRGGAIQGTSHTADSITVHFQGRSYTYSHASAGKAHVQAMQALARQGQGLHSYIRQHAPRHEEPS